MESRPGPLDRPFAPQRARAKAAGLGATEQIAPT